MKVMITCKEATSMVSEKEEGKLSFSKRMQLGFHLVICGFCKLFYRQNNIIISTASNLPNYTDATFSPVEKEKMIKVLEAEPR